MTTTRHTEPNTELFKKIHKQLKKQPGSLDMGHWEFSAEYLHGERFYNPFAKEFQPRSCGTTRCVAGWAGHFTNPTQAFGHTIQEIANEWGLNPYDDDFTVIVGAGLLGLDERDARTLFLDTGDAKAVRVVKKFAKGKNKKALELLRDGNFH